MLRTLLVPAIVCCALAAPAAAQGQVYEIDAFDVTLQLRADGVYEVVETITFGFREGTFSQGFRTIPARRIDEIRDVSVRSPDTNVAEVDHDRDGSDHVIEWTFPERSEPATFVVRYVVTGALTAGDGRNAIDWNVVGDDVDVPIRLLSAEVVLPHFGLERSELSVEPSEEGALERTENAWRATFTHSNLPAETAYRVVVSFPQQLDGRAPPAPPIYFLYGLLAFIVSLVPGVLEYRRRRGPRPAKQSAKPELPDLPLPETALLILDSLSFSARVFPATLFDLARRGHLSLRQSEARKWHGTEERLEVDVHPDRADLSDFEAEFLDKLGEYDSFQKFAEKTTTYRYEAAKPVRERLVERGLMEDRRAESNRQLVLAACLAIGGSAIVLLLSDWAVAVAIGITAGTAVGTAFVGSIRHRLTDEGARSTANAQAFINDLRTSIEESLETDPAVAARLLAENLPWLLLDSKIDEAWLKRFEKAVTATGAEIQLPEWIGRSLGSDDTTQIALLMSTVTMSHASSVYSTAFATGAGASGGVGGGSVGAR